MEAIRSKDDLISSNLIYLLEEIGTNMKIYKDMYLFQEGMNANEIYLIKSGLIHIHQLTSEGRELKLRICKKNDIVGELILFADDAKYMLSGKVMADGEVLVINKDELEK